MNNDMEKTPLWLDLRKEYIDDNFAKLQEYLKGCAVKQTNDSFYSITIDLMRQRVDDLLSTISMRPLYHEEMDRKTLEYSPSQGYRSLRKALVNYYNRYQIKLDVDEIIITNGSFGSRVLADREIKIDAFECEEVVDTTGCGDTYMAAYVSHRLKNCSIEESGNFASRIASEKLKRSGHY